MKKGTIASIIIIVLVILGIGLVVGYKYFTKDLNQAKVARELPIEQVNVKKIPDSKDIVVNVTGDNNINKLVVAEVLKQNNIQGVQVDININSEAYGGVSGSEVLKTAAQAVNMQIPQNNYKLANILIASSTGLDMLDTKENVYKVITLTNKYFENNYSNQGLFMGEPNKILDQYSPAIKNNEGADSLYVQMCIFLNQYYTNLNQSANNNSNNNSNSN
ncbi:MAG: hypothetical protein ACRCTZ_07275 [Sarcina sp.]